MLSSARLQRTHALPSQQNQNQGRRRALSGLSMSDMEDEVAFTGSRLEFQPTPDLGSSKNKMLHVVYRVGNMDRAIKFYQDVFGMEVRRRFSLCACGCACYLRIVLGHYLQSTRSRRKQDDTPSQQVNVKRIDRCPWRREALEGNSSCVRTYVHHAPTAVYTGTAAVCFRSRL